MATRTMVEAFNEWMCRYTEEPEAFAHEWQSVTEFLATPDGEEPSYGVVCAAYLARLMDGEG